jgi:chemotaxis protein methyltransferase CheR
MKDASCVAFLQWALPRMQLAWPGFRNVRRTVCRRVDRRYRALGLADVTAYRAHLEATPAEWEELRSLCSIPISRFYRDRAIFESLEHVVLRWPPPCSRAIHLECWARAVRQAKSVHASMFGNCSSARYPRLQLRVLATDIDLVLPSAPSLRATVRALEKVPVSRARTACRRVLRAQAFRAAVRITHQDICAAMPEQNFDLILCRNVVLPLCA